MKKRITWLDMAKGYGMLAVIFAHLYGGQIHNWIYSFHIPLFFILSGYVFNPQSDFKTFFKKKVKGYIIPYFCLGIPLVIVSVLYYIRQNGFGLAAIYNCIVYTAKLFIQRRTWTLWFIACLFVLNILFYAAVKLLKKDIWLAIASVALCVAGFYYYRLGGVVLPWNIDASIMAFPFFYVGYFLRQHTDFFSRLCDDRRNSIITFVICGILNVVCWRLTVSISGSGLEMFESSYGCLPLTYISAISGSICVIIFSKWFTLNSIRYIGENSLLYFAWHQTIMIPLSKRIVAFCGLSLNEASSGIEILMLSLLIMLLVIFETTICNMLIKRTKFSFVLGK